MPTYIPTWCFYDRFFYRSHSFTRIHRKYSVRKSVCKIHRKIAVPECFLIKLQATILKKRPWHRCFPVNFSKYLRTPFYRTTLGDCFCSLLNVLLSIRFHTFIVHSESEHSSETLLNISSLLCILCLLFLLCLLCILLI